MKNNWIVHYVQISIQYVQNVCKIIIKIDKSMKAMEIFVIGNNKIVAR